MIRTRDFAKIKFSRSTESLVTSDVKTDVDVGAKTDAGAVARGEDDVISLSSTEEKPLISPKEEVNSRKKRKRKPKNITASVRQVRTLWKTPLTSKYSRITDFFQMTKRECTSTIPQTDTKATNASDAESGVAPIDYDSDIECIEIEPPSLSSTCSTSKNPQCNESPTENSKQTSTSAAIKMKQLKVILERMDITPYLNEGAALTRKRRLPSDQSKLDEFIDCKTNNVGYFDTYHTSALPLTDYAMVRIECVELTHEKFKVEPKSADDAAVVHAMPNTTPPNKSTENEENDKNGENIASAILDNNISQSIDASDNTNSNASDGAIGSKNLRMALQPSLIEEQILSFGASTTTCPSILSDGSSKNYDINLNHIGSRKKSRKPKQKVQFTGKKQSKNKIGLCPSYKMIVGTNLAVDAFRYGDIEGVEHYFLSHFHADHYIGLKKSFNHHLYLSEITGRLVHTFIKVDRQYMHFMPLQKPIVVDDVEVTALEANHCPGAVMFLFKLKTGKCILHTGDFRASTAMEEYPEFWNNTIDSIYLDTTYLSNKYAFQSQNDSIDEVKFECAKFLKKNAGLGRERCLIVCGAYKIGKEKVWMSIADEFNFKVFIDGERRKAMECLGDSNVLAKLTVNPLEANIHVMTLGNLNYQQMVQYLQSYNETFNVLLAVRPSGWESKSRKPSYASNVSLLGIQYSEHSSYNELERFVRFLQPSTVISTVPNTKNLDKTTNVPAAWMNATILKPNKEPHQPTIKDMLRKNRQTVEARSTATDKSEMDKDVISANYKKSNLPTSSTTINDISSDSDYMP